MNFSSHDFEFEDSKPPAAPASPRPLRHRAVLGTMLAGIIALILIAIVLAIISALGERRLALLQRPSIAVVTPPHSTRATPGLLAPSPLPDNPVAVPPVDLNPVPVPAPAAAPAAVIAPPVAEAQQVIPPPVAVSPPPTARQVRQFLAALPFARIHDAFLWKPYSDPNPKLLQHPAPGMDLVQLRQASRLSPQALQVIAEQRRPLPTLNQLRAQAAMNRTGPTSRPSM